MTIYVYSGNKTINATVIGSPTINNGVVSGFSTSNYVLSPTSTNLNSANSWEILLKVAHNTGSLLQQNNNNPFTIALRCGMMLVRLDGDSGWTAVYPNSESGLVVGNWYYIKASFNGSQYKFERSTNGTDFTLLSNLLTTRKIISNTQPFVFGTNDNHNDPYGGSIDLKESYIKMNGQTWWEGMKPVYNKIKGIYVGSNKISKIYNGSDLVYYSDPYPPGTVLLNINSGGTGTVNFYKGRYRIYAQGGGGGGGSNNFWNNGSGGGSGAGFDGIVKFTQDMLNVACSTGAAPGTSGTGATTTIGSIFSLGGGRGGGSASAGAGGTYSYTSGSGYSIESSTVARNGDAGKANGGAGWGRGANSILTGTGSNPSAGGAATAFGAGGTGGDTSVNAGGKGSGGECIIVYVGQ